MTAKPHPSILDEGAAMLGWIDRHVRLYLTAVGVVVVAYLITLAYELHAVPGSDGRGVDTSCWAPRDPSCPVLHEPRPPALDEQRTHGQAG